MSVKPNGTDAKDIGLHFLKETGVERMTPAIVSRTISQAKHLLEAGYTKEEVISVINHIVKRGIHMYSIGYVSSAINDVLHDIEREKSKESARGVAEEQKKQQEKMRGVVDANGETTRRNAAKAGRFGTKSRLGEKFDFDMFKG